MPRCSPDPPSPVPCPISVRSAKRDVRYLTPEELEGYARELRRIRLATYRYRHEDPGAPERLGFIIDDGPPAACVEAARERVDLYGYASLAVAALQAQAREIEYRSSRENCPWAAVVRGCRPLLPSARPGQQSAGAIAQASRHDPPLLGPIGGDANRRAVVAPKISKQTKTPPAGLGTMWGSEASCWESTKPATTPGARPSRRAGGVEVLDPHVPAC